MKLLSVVELCFLLGDESETGDKRGTDGGPSPAVVQSLLALANLQRWPLQSLWPQLTFTLIRSITDIKGADRPVDNCKKDHSTKENDNDNDDNQEFHLLAIMFENCSSRLADGAAISAEAAVEWEHEDKNGLGFTL